ncbi:uncharacterized protein LOC132751904 [Ruditapes philippinarum]|uniref:uncharacterized protein LOC132751904 n=1 Tax=Ruditapes philippinarum TaxID=129788 RepID=UPI00295BB502|nr:uncharacterized protein LOC132751904 [Ruditapes philippinarum]
MPSIVPETNEHEPLISEKETNVSGKGTLSLHPKKAPTGRKYSIMTACMVLQFITVGFGYGLSVLYVEVIRVFNSPRSEAALIQSLYFGTMTGGGVCWAWLINIAGPGRCVTGGAILGCVGFLVSGFAINVPMIVAFTGGIAGIGMSLCYLGSFITVSWIFNENPGVALVFLTTGSSLGQVVMPYVIDVFITEFDWSGAYMLLAGIALNCAACGILIHCSSGFFHKGENQDMESSFCNRICDKTLLTDPILLMTLLNVLLLATTGPIEAWFLVDLMVIRGYEREIGSLFVSLTGFANFLGRGIGAVLRLFCKVPTVYHWVYLAPIVAVSHFLVVSFYDYWPLFGANLLYGISFGITVAQEPAIMFEASGLERYPKGIALMNLMYGLGNFFGGLIGGVIKDELGTYDMLFYIAIGASCYVSIATLGIIFCMRKAGTLHRHVRIDTDVENVTLIRYSVTKDEMNEVSNQTKPLLSKNVSQLSYMYLFARLNQMSNKLNGCIELYVAFSLTGILFSGMITKLGPGKSIVLGGIVSSIGLFGSAFAKSLAHIIICTGVITGSAMSITFLSAFITTSAMFPDASLYLIILTSGHSIGQFVIPLLYERFISQYSWSGAFILVSGVSLYYVPFGLLIHCSRGFLDTAEEANKTNSNKCCDTTLTKDIVIWILMMNSFVLFLTFNVESWFIVDHMVSRGFTRESGSLLVSVLGIGSFIGRFVGALLQYKIRWPTVYHWVYLYIFTASLHGIIINLNEFWGLAVSCLLYGVLFAIISSQLPAIVFEASGPDRYPYTMARINMMCGLGDVFGPLLGGFTKDMFGVYDVVFYIAVTGSIFISATSFIIACILRKRSEQSSSRKREIEVK